MKMDEDKTEALIVLVSEYKELFDMSNKNYNNQLRQDNIWNEISKKLDVNAETCKNRWKTLRDGFQRASKNHTKSGDAAKAIRKWRYWDVMSFLAPYVKSRRTLSNITERREETEETDDEEAEETTTEETQQDDDGNVLTPASLSATPASTISGDQESSSSVRNSVMPRSACKQKKTNSGTNNSNSIPEIFKEYINEKKRSRLERDNKLPTNNDPLVNFFINMAQTVETFPAYYQALVKSKVFQIVNSIELELSSRPSATRTVQEQPIFGEPTASSSNNFASTSAGHCASQMHFLNCQGNQENVYLQNL